MARLRQFFHSFPALGEGALIPPSAPLSRAGGRRDGEEGGFAYPRLTPWATLFRPLRGLTSSTNF
jgi:hypothetical protein